MTDHTNLPEVLTISEAARFLRLSRAHVRLLASTGQLPVVRAGRRKGLRVLRADLLAFIRKRRTPGGEESEVDAKTKPVS